MPILSFTLLPDSLVKLHDALTCLAKFNEVVSFEARQEQLVLTALNLSKSAYAAFTLTKEFFSQYNLAASPSSQGLGNVKDNETFTCQILNRALLSVFKGQLKDLKDKDTAIECCKCYVQEQEDQAQCRMVLKMMCRHGVVKTYKLTYEPVQVMHAIFDKRTATNSWSINATTMRSFADHFGPGTEQLDIASENGRTTFTSYTEKVTDGKNVLKQPLQTSITVDNLDFDSFEVQDSLHIGIPVKDFRAVASHAETLRAIVAALYSRPNKPMLLHYDATGMLCEFTLMTIGDSGGTSATPAPIISRQISAAPVHELSSRKRKASDSDQAETSMPAPPRPASRSIPQDLVSSQRPSRASPPPPRPSIDPESIFIPQLEDEDRNWGERNFDEDEDVVGWSASAVTRHSDFELRTNEGKSHSGGTKEKTMVMHDRLPPTQRLSEVEDMFGL